MSAIEMNLNNSKLFPLTLVLLVGHIANRIAFDVQPKATIGR